MNFSQYASRTLASQSTLLSAVVCDESVSGSGWQIGHEGSVLGVLVLMLPKEMGLGEGDIFSDPLRLFV